MTDSQRWFVLCLVLLAAGLFYLLEPILFPFLAGMLLFSGSLYSITLAGQVWLGPVTPLGGLSMIAGWFCLAAAGLRVPQDGR